MTAYQFREGTSDAFIFQSIFSSDEYRLPKCFAEEDIVIDIGAHIGFFSLAVLQRGIGHVYAFEPDIDNYRLAIFHLHNSQFAHFLGSSQELPHQEGYFKQKLEPLLYDLVQCSNEWSHCVRRCES